MYTKRKTEYFVGCQNIIPNKSVSYSCEQYFKQERDWTCSIACIRTMSSKFMKEVPSEDFFVEAYELKPGPHYSKDIKALGILDEFNTIYGCDIEESEKSVNTIIDAISDGYAVMMETMLNYDHWVVVLGYFIIGEPVDLEKHTMLVYDPYYDKVRLLMADEFLAMWIDGDHSETGVIKDFIAIK